VHVDTPENNAKTPFDFTQENYVTVREILAKYPKDYIQSGSLPLLDLAQRQEGWISLSAMNKIAKILKIPEMEIYEVATFYTMFRRQKSGKYIVSVCTTTPCEICGSEKILHTIEKHLGIHVGETTPDGLFTLMEVECLGACVNAPMIQVDDDYYEDLTPETTINILETLKKGKKPNPGPQTNRRKVAEPFDQLTSLLDPLVGPFAPRLEALDKAAAAAATQPKTTPPPK